MGECCELERRDSTPRPYAGYSLLAPGVFETPVKFFLFQRGRRSHMNVQKDLVLHLYALNDFSKFYNFSMPEHSKLATIGIRNTIANLSACRRALVPFGDNKYSQLVTRPTRCLRPRALSTLDALLGCHQYTPAKHPA